MNRIEQVSKERKRSKCRVIKGCSAIIRQSGRCCLLAAKVATLRRINRMTERQQRHTGLIFEVETEIPDPNNLQRMSGHWGGTSYSIPSDSRQEQPDRPRTRGAWANSSSIQSETSPPRKDLQGELGADRPAR